jgi:lipopolysaccharide transport system ATP-binding protein
MKPILEIRNIGKKYKIQHLTGGYLSLRERMVTALKFERNHVEDFWALQDVSFDVQPGESIGIIGRNGAGKSTLLKILSKITPPTTGHIISRGRIASLLEVGTGFHLELTGRENIFFNGSLLGMKRREIENKFDEIVDFSGVEKFLDTPLKHFSSGMQLRLAFAVAAFLEPEILIIDEVLAVGDAEFQRKCLGKMEDVGRSGRTILFVSHNLDAVEALCKTSVLLSKGILIEQGVSAKIIGEYISDSDNLSFRQMNLTDKVVLHELSFSELSIFSGDALDFRIVLKVLNNEDPLISDLCLLFYNYKKQRVAIFDMRRFFKDFQTGNGYVSFTGKIERFNLVDGFYYIGLFYGLNSVFGDVYDLTKIQVKSDLSRFVVNPYDVIYRGFVELT